MKNLLLLSIASILSICAVSNNAGIKKSSSNNENNIIYVGEASTYEEKVKVAKDNLSLNVDESHIVTTLNLPFTGLYKSTITWSSSNENVLKIDEQTKHGLVTRGDNDVNVKLTALIEIRDNKNNVYSDTKVFNLTVLKKASSSSSTSTTSSIEEDFKSYAVGDDLSEYLRWDLTSGDPLATTVTSVPNNNMVSTSSAVKILSKKTANQTSYVRNFNLSGKIAFEGYLMYTGDINGIYFELGRDGVFGPSIGIKEGKFTYYNNGERVVSEDVVKPTEGVWQKFRLEVNASAGVYKAYIYKMDGTNEVIDISGLSTYSNGNKTYLNELRIRSTGGSKVGEVYASDLKVVPTASLPVNEGENPNREDGIGLVENFNESVLYINGKEDTYSSGFVVHNRFNEEEIYTEGSDYSLTKETVSSSTSKDVYTYTIKLLSTGEEKVLIQTVYKEDEESLPFIDSFKASHLARKVVNEETGELSSTASINFKGTVNRSDSTIYYAVVKASSSAPSKEEIIEGTSSSFIKKGSFEQTERDVDFSIDGLALNNEYSLYVVIKNAYGSSEIYSKTNISEVINITTCEEFYDMTVNIDTYKNEFRLMNDLDFSSFDWVCDINNTLKFQGTLDGNGHTIKNLNIRSPYRKAAIFYEITNATIKNLNFENPTIEGLQDSAVICGFSNGGTIENITFTNPVVNYNKVEGSEGYFAIVAGRLHKDTTNMTNITVRGANITCNKYCGVLTGNVNKNNDCVLNAKNINVDASIICDGAAVGLVGRNRGTTNVENAFIALNILNAKKEMGILAGHNKEGGVLNVKNVIGFLEVSECTQPTYFNYFIGSQDDNTSSYSYENVYFVQGDYSSISDSLTPVSSTRTCGVTLSRQEEYSSSFWEQNTFIGNFASNKLWSYDETTNMPYVYSSKVLNVKADDVNTIINSLKNDLSEEDHINIYNAYSLYNVLTDEEKAKVDLTKLENAKFAYEDVLNQIDDIVKGL